MKKNVFDLSYNEGKKIDKKLKETSYYRQYLIMYICSCFILLIGLIFVTSAGDLTMENELLCFMLTFGFLSVITILFGFKRFNLIKQYYDEKVINKDEK